MLHDVSEKLLPYYQQEIQYLLEAGQRFSNQYPHVARSLDFQGTSMSQDPHVQRLLESFAFLTSRLHLEIDDRFSFFTQSLLGALYPQFINPIPSCTVVQMTLESSMAKQLAGIPIPAHTLLRATSQEGKVCTLRTTMEQELWPLEISNLSIVSESFCIFPYSLKSPWILKIRLNSLAGTLKNYRSLKKLTFYLTGDSVTTHTFYRWLFTYDPQKATPVFFKNSQGTLYALPPLQHVGFEENQSLLPFEPQTPRVYRLLLEYFVFPEKFLFFDVLSLGDFFQEETWCDLFIPLNAKAQTTLLPSSPWRTHLKL